MGNYISYTKCDAGKGSHRVLPAISSMLHIRRNFNRHFYMIENGVNTIGGTQFEANLNNAIPKQREKDVAEVMFSS